MSARERKRKPGRHADYGLALGDLLARFERQRRSC
jgi:hypothetical protein